MAQLNVVLTGSHGATTALSVVNEIETQNLPWEIHFIGSARAVEGKSVPTLESQILGGEGVYFHPIIAGRLQRRFNFWTIPSLIKIPVSFFHALTLLLKIRPKVILSFGGASGAAVTFAGWVLGIPSLVHEQTASAGRANLFSSHFVKIITLARGSSKKFFPKGKTEVIGNPLLPAFRELKVKTKLGNPPAIYITAGSRGSVIINSQVEEILRKLLAEFRITHQTGKLDEAKFRRLKDNLPAALSSNYEVFGQISPGELTRIYEATDIVISRAGANSVAEIIAAKRPSLLIPIPWSYQDEQNKNANFAKAHGVARVLNQETLTPQKLLSEINRLKKDWAAIFAKIKGVKSPDTYAAKRLVDLVKKEIR